MSSTTPPSEARTANGAAPNLRQQEQISKLLVGKAWTRRYKSLVQSNVVLHSSLKPVKSRRRHLANMFGRDMPTLIPGDGKMRIVSAQTTPSSPFAHYKIKTTTGTILLFKSSNIIRSGGYSVGRAVTSLFQFINYLRTACPDTHPVAWASAAAVPNSVYSGQFAEPVSPSFRTAACATFTSKFPGIAVTLPIRDRITPELFLKDSKFIIPGVKSPEALASALETFAAATLPHCTAS